MQALVNGSRIYERLAQLFQQADDRYNSGLFHFKAEPGRHEAPDELTLELNIDDELLRRIIKHLYYPESPYVFSFIPADILGQVYEQFLGKVITLTAGHRAKIEEKPEVRKAGGVYYTPTYIVDYIVRHTVGKLLDEAAGSQSSSRSAGVPPASSGGVPPPGLPSPSQIGPGVPAEPLPGPVPTTVRSPQSILNKVAKLKILDPACGSGSFLIGAYQYLLDWHLRFYLANNPEKFGKGKRPTLVQTARGEWKLSIEERKRILINNIYGVDIDSQAVEVTKLSLLLKVLEGETEQSLQPLFSIFHERALPDLGDNIKCGNSLIGPDFYQQPDLPALDEEQRYRLNAFDWHAEFPEIFKAGGFDAVIGNPPYVRIQGFPREQIGYLTRKYRSATGNCDLYVSFVERAFSLLGKNGRLGKIIPNKFFRTDYGVGLRGLLSETSSVTQIVDFGADQVFPATTYTCLLFLRKGENPKFAYVQAKANEEALRNAAFVSGDAGSLSHQPWSFENRSIQALANKLSQKTVRLLDLPAEMSRGSSTGADTVFVFSTGAIKIEADILRQPLFASDFGRYRFAIADKWRVIFPYHYDEEEYRLYSEAEMEAQFPKAYAYLKSHSSELKKRKQFKAWYGYSAPRNLKLHDEAQIAVPLLANRGMFTLIPKQQRGKLCPMASGGFTISIASSCPVRVPFVIGLLNSRLLFWKLQQLSNVFRGGWITCTKQYFGELPIRVIDFSDPTDKGRYDSVVSLVEQMMELQVQHSNAKTPHEKTALERHIAATDKQIDALVYELYGLTAEEIAIVEGRAPTAESAAWAASVSDVAEARTEPEPQGRQQPATESPNQPNPEKAWADSAHYYSVKEEAPPYRTENINEKDSTQ